MEMIEQIKQCKIVPVVVLKELEDTVRFEVKAEHAEAELRFHSSLPVTLLSISFIN